jgi:hypothetical protein
VVCASDVFETWADSRLSTSLAHTTHFEIVF